jgi:orotidine-5'-phosphate decarboxylase
MIEAARRAVEGSETKLLAVTVLTSLSDEMLRDELGLQETAAEAVARLAKLAAESGAHGLICSPQEIATVREAAGRSALIVTPGVRPAWAQQDDQSRVMTPKEAAQAGSDFIVVGRPIFKAKEPADAVRRILHELRDQSA